MSSITTIINVISYILIAFVEGIMRRPLPEKVRIGLQVAGILILVGLMLFALGNDLMRLWRINRAG